MGSLSLWHWLIVIAVVLILFGGRGKISDVMGDFAKGIKSFKKGLADDDSAEKPAESTRVEDAKAIEQQTFVKPEFPEPRGETPKKAAAPKRASTAKATAAKTTTRKKSS